MKLQQLRRVAIEFAIANKELIQQHAKKYKLHLYQVIVNKFALTSLSERLPFWQAKYVCDYAYNFLSMKGGDK